jgi:prevent-host-death family protein
MSDNPTVWSVSQAKARFSEVIDQALEQSPQTITRNGRPAVIVVTAEQWARKPGRKSTVADFFAASPPRGSGLDIERLQRGVREVVL